MRNCERNKYFFIEPSKTAIEEILNHCVEKDINNARLLYDGYYAVKLPIDANIPDILKNKIAYTYTEATEQIKIHEQGRPLL